MRIAEIYKSIQGEGRLTGTESVFVRASGCNLRCRFCDTPYASWEPEGDDLAAHEIVEAVEPLGCRYVVLTGGEPMLFSEAIPLCDSLHRGGYHITIETAGTLHLPVECDLMSISPKLANSTPQRQQSPRWAARHDRTRHAPDVIRRLIDQYNYQLKFVVETRADCQEVEAYLRDLPEIDRTQVMLMPQGTSALEMTEIGGWLEPYCLENGLEFCPRRQIEWFGLTRGT